MCFSIWNAPALKCVFSSKFNVCPFNVLVRFKKKDDVLDEQRNYKKSTKGTLE